MVKRLPAYDTEKQQDRSFFRWIFTRWYFWFFYGVCLLITWPGDQLFFSEFLGILLGNFIVPLIVFGLGRGIYLLSTKK